MTYKKKSLIALMASFVLVVIICTAFATSAVAAGSSDASAGTTGNIDASVRSASNYETQEYQQAVNDWEQFGVTYNTQEARFYYKGEVVRFFVDNRNPNPKKFSGTVYDCSDGSNYLVTRRDETGKLIAIDEITEAEAAKIAVWR